MANLQHDGHVWSRREIDFSKSNNLLSHRQCKNCGRDFAAPKGTDQWVAVYVGIFDLIPLSPAINARWLTEACPGKRLPEDRNEIRDIATAAAGDKPAIRLQSYR